MEGIEFVKDLTRLNRDPSRVVVLDTKKTLVTLPGQTDNVLRIKKFDGDANDTQLFELMAFLERMLVYTVLHLLFWALN